jgi:hypothetical protein
MKKKSNMTITDIIMRNLGADKLSDDDIKDIDKIAWKIATNNGSKVRIV